MTREVIFAPEALTDLFELYDIIAADAGAARAHNYTDRIVATCRNLVTFPERGTRRDDLRPGLRTTTYRRRVTIAYHITDTQVVIDRILYAGRNLPPLFAGSGDDDR
ncbi:MAG TPA: type II toxin-antitoxin system RelE/ParE family toxin [Acetobacteraceae bacterium]|nr:type II toxin-antitoxin system RelE/ParE family toxin [Acetobacteraceae bacterium]HUB49151.1 type II toxin-antitoxin system RelE/ParE family toxin [Acetobacteraceae bacterium]